MDDQETNNPQENKTIEENLLSKFFTCPQISTALFQIVAENPEIEEAITALMSCPEVEAIKICLANLLLTNLPEGHRPEQLASVANGGDIDAFLIQNPGVLSLLNDSPLVTELLESMELGLLKAMGLQTHETPSNKRLAEECYNLAQLIVEVPSFKQAMANVDLEFLTEDNADDG